MFQILICILQVNNLHRVRGLMFFKINIMVDLNYLFVPILYNIEYIIIGTIGTYYM